MKFYLTVALCSILFFSCQGEKKKTDPILLKHEVMRVNDSLVMGVPMKLGYVNDNLIILDFKSEAFFHWIKFPESQYMGTFGNRGQGPNEFLNVKSLHALHDTLYAYDFYKSELVQLIPNKQELTFKKVANLPKGWSIDLLPLNKYLYCSNGCFEEGMFHLIDSLGNILYVSEDYPAQDEAEAKLSNQVRFMAYQGCMETNGKGCFAYLTSQCKQCYIYELQHGSLVKTATNIESYSQYKPNEGDGFSVTHDVNALTGYRDIIAAEDYFYALYSGRSFKEFQTKCFECTNLFVYDWEGKLLKTYELDIPVTTICLDKKRNILYATANIPNPILVRFFLPN